jgi:hypothetical protein
MILKATQLGTVGSDFAITMVLLLIF